jgi:hypothetical protein
MNDKLYYYVNSYYDTRLKKQIVHKPIVVTIENWHGSQAVIRTSSGRLQLADYYQLWSQNNNLTFNQIDEEIKKYYGDEAVYI